MPVGTLQPTPLLDALNEFTRTGDAAPAVGALEAAGFVDTPSSQIHRPVTSGERFCEFLGPDFKIVVRQSSPGAEQQYALMR